MQQVNGLLGFFNVDSSLFVYKEFYVKGGHQNLEVIR